MQLMKYSPLAVLVAGLMTSGNLMAGEWHTVTARATAADGYEVRASQYRIVTVSTVLCCAAMIFAFSGKLKVEDGLTYAKKVASSILEGRVFQKTETEQEIERLAAHIPVGERDSVFSMETDPKFYAFSGIIPAKRMFVCQTLFTDIYDAYHKEFVSYFSDDPPKWLVTENPLEELDVSGTKPTLLANYHLIDKTNIFYLYERSETNETH